MRWQEDMTFDAYHKWLGIPAEDQPPNHYRLLAINLFEDDLDVIESAADRQMAHVRTFQGGPHSADSQKLLNELSAAKISLLHPQKRAAYDAELRRQLAAAQEPPPSAAPTQPPLPPAPRPQPVAQPVRPALVPAAVNPLAAPELVFERASAMRNGRPRRRRNSGWPLAGVAALSAALVVGYLVWTKPGAEPIALAPPNARPAKTATNPRPDLQPPAPKDPETPSPPTADMEASVQPPDASSDAAAAFLKTEVRENSPPDRLPAVAESTMPKPSATGLAESLAEKAANEPANAPPPAANSNAIAAMLVKAKADYLRDMQKVCDSLETYIDKRIESSARRRTKGPFDAAVQMRVAFDQDGRMPATAPSAFKQKAAKARADLERTYRTAIDEYASARQSASAAALVEELNRLGDPEQIGRFRRELLRNPGCEQPPQGSGIPGWTAIKGPWQRREKDPPPQEGTGYFLPGDCAEGELVQDIDVELYAPRIDSGKQKFEFTGFVRSFKQQPPDTSRIVVEYRDSSNSKILDAADSGPIANVDAWQLVSDKRLAPRETRWVRVRLISTRYGGRENDGYYDGLSFRAVEK